LKLQLFIAFRYLVAKKSNNIINWITGISVVVVSIVTCALIIIMSAMNGLSESVMDLYSDFDPDLKITAVEGKRIHTPEISYEKIKAINGVQYLVESIEETVLLKYRDHQEVATLKGVSSDFEYMTDIEGNLVDGFYALRGNGKNMCVLGTDLALKLGVNIGLFEPIHVYVPNLFGGGGAFGGDYFKSVAAAPVGVFDITSDFNAKFLLVNKELAEDLLGLENEVSSLEIGLLPDADLQMVKAEVQKVVGESFVVKTRFEQNEFLFRSINAEKWITLFILSLIVVLAVFNVVGSLTILIIDKNKDIYVLQSMGASVRTLRTIFWMEGLLISFFGTLIGLALGLGTCWIQTKYCYFGYGASGGIDCFPILVDYKDVIIVFVMVNGIALLTSLVPVFKVKGGLSS
jgi:lipoprotein-releasing system permease protein